MMEQDKTDQNQPSQQDSIDFKELFNLLWRGKLLIVLITAVFALCSVFYALSLTNVYRSEAVLTLAQGPSEIASLSRFSGIASLAGITMPSGGTDKGALIVNTIMSRVFLKSLLSVEGVLPSLMAAKSYDSESKKLELDPNIYDTADKKWLQGPPPSYLAAYNVYMGQMTIDYYQPSGLIYLSVVHISPVFAQEFLDLIIHEADTMMRQQDLQQSSDALEYLASEISKTSLIEMKGSMSQLIRSQLETQMMAKISTDYALKVIEPPFIPEIKFKPSRSLISILGTGLGFVLGILLILIRYYFDLTGISMPSGVTDKGALIVKTIRNKIKLIKISFPKRIQ